MAPSTPTSIVFVPGAWHSPTCYSVVAYILRQAGYSTSYVTLPSVGPPEHFKDFSADVVAIRSQIQKSIDKKHKVVVCVHSYGGIPINEAIKDFPPGAVSHIFYTCSFLVPEGNSLLTALGGQDPSWFLVSEDRLEANVKDPAKTFYNDLREDEAFAAARTLKPFSYMTQHSPISWAAWKHVPSTYLYCLKDAALPIQVQKMMVEEWAKGYDIKTETLDSSHSPFLSQPDAMAAAIRRAAGEEV